MKLSVKLAGFIAALLLSGQTMATTWASYFPTNTPVKARVMTLASSPEENEIARKLHAGLAKNQQWFATYMKELQPGQEMPYHENFGISKNEYLKYIRLIAHQKMTQTGTVDIIFQQEKDGTIKIKTKQKSPINGLIINQSSVITPFGKTTQYSPTHNANTRSATGQWKGIEWSLDEFDERLLEKHGFDKMVGKDIKLAVGTLEKSGEGILSYTVKDLNIPKGKKIQISYVIYYPLVK